MRRIIRWADPEEAAVSADTAAEAIQYLDQAAGIEQEVRPLQDRWEVLQDRREALEEADHRVSHHAEAVMEHRHHQEEDITGHHLHQEEDTTEHRHHHLADTEAEEEAAVYRR